MTDAIASVTVGVADMAPVYGLWVERFGLQVLARLEGPDEAIARLWSIEPDDIAAQLIVATPGTTTGRLHFVQFSSPGPTIRDPQAISDFGAKNLDVNCRDMPARFAELEAAGYRFRSTISEYTVDGIQAREVQFHGHDGTNIVLIEVLGDGFDCVYTANEFAALTSFVVIVPDAAAESGFFQTVLGFDVLMHHRLSGPAIEQAVGAPPGTVLDMHLLGRENNLFGRVELITYEGCPGRDRFTAARPPATGILGCAFAVDNLEAARRRVTQAGGTVERELTVDGPMGNGATAICKTPAGLRFELFKS